MRGDSHQIIYDKSVTVIDEHIRNFPALSTFLTVASIDAEGRMDVSPKGDPPGFVKVVDERTIAIPEREAEPACRHLHQHSSNPFGWAEFF